jgi:hypothetical protein
MLTLLVIRGLAAWRSVRSLSRVTTDALAAVTAQAGTAEGRATDLTSGAERLQGSLAHLQRSLDRLAVLQDAAGDVRATLSLARRTMPRK